MAEVAIDVIVAFALPDRQWLIPLGVPAGTTVREAILCSGLLEQVPGIDLGTARVGIYGKLSTMETVVRSLDRIEVYRPLIADPKEARRKRVTQARDASTL